MRSARRPPRVNECGHQDRKHYGKGKCRSCKGCNSALGHVADDRSRLAGLIEYLGG